MKTTLNKSVLTGDTLVFTPTGYRCIKSLEVGDEVISLNTNTDQPETKKVKAIQKNISDSMRIFFIKTIYFKWLIFEILDEKLP